MSIPNELLNNQLKAFEVHTGVYQTHARRSTIVVKVDKTGRVFYLTLLDTYRIVLEHCSYEKFLAEHPLELYHYPVLRAVRRYASWVREGCPITEEARKVINAILTKR